MNVVNNALDYSPQKGSLYMSVQCEDSWVRFVVSDEGCGFSKEALNYAQERFFMDEQSRNSKIHFGMGLYITDSIMKQHEGSMSLCNSEQTHGAEIILRIPYK